MKSKVVISLAAMIALSGCSSLMKDSVSQRAPFDLNCGKSSLKIHELGYRTYGVSGCGKRATYVVQGHCQGLGSSCIAVMNTDVNPQK